MRDRYPTTPEQARDLADSLPWPKLVDWLVGLAADDDPRAIAALRHVLGARSRGTYEKHLIPRLAARALLHRGPSGVAVMAEMIPRAPGSIYPTVLLRTLWEAREGKLEEDLSSWGPQVEAAKELAHPVPAETQRAADEAIDALLADSLSDVSVRWSLIQMLWELGTARDQQAASRLLEVLAQSSIRLSPRLIGEFDRLVAADHVEEEYQQFLATHPVFLDPLAAEVIPKQKLGLEHITDYAVRRHDGRWLLVEIEKPQTPIITRSNDFTSEFIHAFGQVVDFQRWVEHHGEYARSRLPGVASPRGLLVVGRRSALQPEGADKLRRFVANSATIAVVTFDDLAANARILFRSMHGHGSPDGSSL